MKLLIRCLLGLFVLVTLPLIGCRHFPAKTSAEVTEAEYRVLSVYITTKFVSDKGENPAAHRLPELVLFSQTRGELDDRSIAFLYKQFPTLESVLLDSFQHVNTHPSTFHSAFSVSVPYAVVDQAEVDAITKKGEGWRNYYDKYPNSSGILFLSRVGFSPDGKQAAFVALNRCGSQCGNGKFVVMENVDSSWKIVNEVLIWSS
jgi:hypothetical protein